MTLAQEKSSRVRARDLGLAPGIFSPGPLNAITDLAGVRVGHTTLIQNDDVRTGVTAIIPAEGNLFQDKVPGAVFVGNAFGKLAGSTQIEELGTIETPIVLTNTLSIGAGLEGAIAYTLSQPGNEKVVSVNAIVGETNDSRLEVQAREPEPSASGGKAGWDGFTTHRNGSARAVFGLARTGSSYSNGSGDYAIAFSTADAVRLKRRTDPTSYTILQSDQVSPLFELALEATQEAVYNSLLQATTIQSKLGRGETIPIEDVKSILSKHGISPKA